MYKVVFFMCKTDYNYELGETTTETFDSLETLLRKRSCVKQCGAVKITLNPNGTYKVEDVIKENREWK